MDRDKIRLRRRIWLLTVVLGMLSMLIAVLLFPSVMKRLPLLMRVIVVMTILANYFYLRQFIRTLFD